MKKLISIILVLVLAFAFSITALAEDTIWIEDPADLGENFEDIGIVLDDSAPEDATIYIEAYDAGSMGEDDWDNYYDEITDIVWDYFEDPAFDEDVYFNSIQHLFEAVVAVDEEIVTGVGGRVTITNYFMGNATLNAILHYFQTAEDGDWEFLLITDFEYDAETGVLSFYVEDFAWWSIFLALIERGVDPEVAAQVASARSPRTADNSIHFGIVMLIVLSAAATTVVVSKKVRSRV